MFQIPVVIGSVRRGRQSPKVAHHVMELMSATGKVTAELLDLQPLDIPIMAERLRMRDDPPPGAVTFGTTLARADAVLFVTPEYNFGIPGVLKNAIDYLGGELKRKPVGIITLSGGAFGGIYCLQQMRQTMMALGAVPVSASLSVPKVQAAFDEHGKPTDPAFDKRSHSFIDEFLWLTEKIAAKR